MSNPVVTVEGLSVELDGGAAVVDDVSFALRAGEVLGLVGESGSGKTTTGLALLGYARPGMRIARGSVMVGEEQLTGRSENELRPLRGKLVSYVPQDPAAGLNPAIRIGAQVAKVLREHMPDCNARERVASVLERVQLPSERSFQRRFPHQLSGGQQQRLAIAIALVCNPSVVVMDEPTTGLDVVTQSHILEEINRLRRELGIAIVYVSHNLAVVGTVADRVAVMYAGSIIEQGPTERILRKPKHPYTYGLVAAIADPRVPRRLRGIPGVAVGAGDWGPGCPFAPRCFQKPARAETEMPPVEEVGPDHHVRCFEWRNTPPLELEEPLAVPAPRITERPLLTVESLRAEHRTREGVTVAAHDVSFTVAPGESVALVGESGSGKTTIARCVAGLHPPAAGKILLDNIPLAYLAKQRPLNARRRVQIVFQNPYDSLNPRMRIGDAIARPAQRLQQLSRRQADAEVERLLECVRLPARLLRRYPSELSGGERQRVAIARALAAAPELLICDEITSALDVSVQAAVLELLSDLRAELDLSLLFISHDLGVVATVCERVLVLNNGVVREEGPVRQVLSEPSDEYTRVLVRAAPRL